MTSLTPEKSKVMRIQSENTKQETKWKSEIPRSKNQRSRSDIGNINSPGQRIGQIVLYDQLHRPNKHATAKNTLT